MFANLETTSPKRLHRRWLTMVIVSTTAVLTFSGLPAMAQEPANELVNGPVTQAIEQAVNEQGVVPSADNPDLVMPEDASEPLSLSSDDESGPTIDIELPAVGESTTAGDSTIYEGEQADTSVAVQPLANGLRAFIHIDNAQAAEAFDFPLSGDVAELRLNDNGGFSAYTANGELIAIGDAPWARDANGAEVPTHYEINGTTLTQVVDHHGGDWAYGITADPSVWKVLRCTAAITIAVGSTVFAVAKLAKIKKLVKAAGGAKKTAGRVIKAFQKKGSLSTKAKAGFGDLGSGVVALAVVILDIDTIKSNCS